MMNSCREGGERRRQVFLDRHLLTFGVDRQVNDAKTARRQLANDPVTTDHRVRWQGSWFDL